MSGLAKKLFAEKNGKSFHLPNAKWQTLSELQIPYIDLILAQKLSSNDSEEMIAFLSYLSFCSRSGDLCVRITEDQVEPELTYTFKNEGYSKEHLDKFKALIIKGSKSLRDDLPIKKLGELFYFERNWNDEIVFYEHFQRIYHSKPEWVIDPNLEIFALLQEQEEAIKKSCHYCLSIITGGPGTGKTYTAGCLIQALTKENPCEVALAAPTGKAASNLEKSIGNGYKAKTLHSLLKEKLTADIVLIDECSMVDARMMAKLFSSVKSKARLILLGDPNQLPAVESGSLFADLIKIPGVNVTHLKKCMRTDLLEIISFANAINEGKFEKKEGILLRDNYSIGDLIDYANRFFPFPDRDCKLKDFQKFRILSPMRRGPFGVDELNQKLYLSQLKRATTQDVLVVPIMLTANDYRLELFNGEVGLLIKKIGEKPYALFSEKKVPALLLPKYEYAYCMSVHKSQGSEFDHVLIVLPDGSEVFGREILYTGITRARKKLEIWGKEETIHATISRKTERLSRLSSYNYSRKF